MIGTFTTAVDRLSQRVRRRRIRFDASVAASIWERYKTSERRHQVRRQQLINETCRLLAEIREAARRWPATHEGARG